jgi:pterin-4a-carbinolamine dehydratase
LFAHGHHPELAGAYNDVEFQHCTK